MANHKSAKKRNRQNIKRREQNSKVKAAVRTVVKQTRAALESGNTEDAKKFLLAAQKKISVATGHGLYHAKNASRKISRLTSAVNKAS